MKQDSSVCSSANAGFFASASHATTLLTSLNELRHQSLLIDVSLRTADGKSFDAHRVVLASCSEYFRAMFTTSLMREPTEREIKLNGVSSEGVGSLIEYAYTSRLSINESNCQSILSAASHLQFLEVLQACSSFLHSRLDLENVLDIVTLAETYSLTSLRKKVYTFMCARLIKFSSSQQFNHLSPHQLESCLRLNLPVDCSETQVLGIVIKWIQFDYRSRVRFTAYLLKQINFREIPRSQMEHTFYPILKSMLNDSQVSYISIQCQLSDCNNVNVISVNNNNNNVRINSPAARLLSLDWRVRPEGKEGEEEASDPDIEAWTACNAFLQSHPSTLMPNPVLSMFSGQQTCSSSRKKNQDKNSLLNTRGMEMAILKIGGFLSTTGVTNEITYTVPNRADARWRYLTSVPHVDQCNFGAAVLNNQLFVVGGCFNQHDLQEHVHPFGFKYDPFTDVWSTIAPMRSERCRFQLVMSGQSLYAMGGSGEHEVHGLESACEVYDAERDEWRPIAGIPHGSRSQHAACSVHDSFIYVSGGLDQDFVLASMLRYCVASNHWQTRRSLMTARADHTMICFKERLLVCGGWYEDEETGVRILHSAVDAYDMQSDSWSKLTNIPTPRYHAGITLNACRLYVIGGFHSDHKFDRGSGAIECYDLEKEYWFSIDPYPQDIWEHTALILHVPSSREDDPEVRPEKL